MQIARFCSLHRVIGLVGAALLAFSFAGHAQDTRAPIEARDIQASEFAGARRGPAGGLLYLRTAIFDPVTERLAVAGLRLRQPSTRYGLVQFEPGTRDGSDRLSKAGLEVVAYQPDNAWLVRWDARKKALAGGIPGVRYTGDYSAEMKLAPSLLQPESMPIDVYRLSDGGLSPPGVGLEIVGFTGTTPRSLAAAVARFAPGARQIESRNAAGWPSLSVWLPATGLRQAVEQLTGAADVYLLDAARTFEWHNIDSVEPIQANTATGDVPPSATPIWNQGLIGAGQIVAVMDSGLDNNEDWFVTHDDGSGPNTALTDGVSPVPPAVGPSHPDRKVFGYWVQPGATAYDNNESCTPTSPPTGFHGTHVAGTVAGDRLATAAPTIPAYDDGDGMAPNAQILFQDIGNDNSGCLAISDLFATLQQAAAGGASIHTNSWGSDARGAYTGLSAAVDAFSRSEQSSLVLFSAGNSGNFGPDTIGAPATAKNALTVGALQHGNSTSVVGFSSRGPTDDGRTKPDIQAPGTGIRSAAGDTTNDGNIEPGSISTKSGTSMSTPTVAGAAAMLRQYFTEGFYPTGSRTPADADPPSGALMKAALLNGTLAEPSFNVPSNDYGWGRVWLDNNLFFDGDARYLRFWDRINEAGLSTGESDDYGIDVLAGEELRITLVWTDVAAAAGAGITLVNDLDLQVIVPGGNIARGNVFSAGESVAGGTFDRLNNVEQILIRSPITGRYDISVIGESIPGDGSALSDRQGYALVVSAAAPPAPVIAAPGNVTASVAGTSGIEIDFDAVAGAERYNIYRAEGDCSAETLDFSHVGQTTGTSFVDTRTIGGFDYSYRVRADDGASEGPISTCGPDSVATSAAACSLSPAFDQTSVTAGDSPGAACGIDLAWAAGSATCPSGDPLRYNIYRSTDPFFIAGAATLLAGDISGTAFTDTSAAANTTYYYVVQAEDNTDPADGNESSGLLRVSAVSVGDGSEPGTFLDGADGLSLMETDAVWSISDNHAQTGVLSYRSAGDSAATYSSNTCATITTPELDLQAGSPQLSFAARYDIESDWDGVVLEISTDGGASWTPITPDGGYPGDFSATGNPPINVCGFPASQGAFNGSTGGAFDLVTADLSAFAGQSVRLRWSLSTDPGVEEEGFYLDDIQVTAASTPAACLAESVFLDGFEAAL